jgi:hypothetical protein
LGHQTVLQNMVKMQYIKHSPYGVHYGGSHMFTMFITIGNCKICLYSSWCL